MQNLSSEKYRDNWALVVLVNSVGKFYSTKKRWFGYAVLRQGKIKEGLGS